MALRPRLSPPVSLWISARLENNALTQYVYDGGECAQERDSAGSLTKTFIRGSGLGGGIGSILYSEKPSQPREYFLYNVIGSVVVTCNQTGNEVSTSLYEAFGKVIASTGSSDNNRLFCTKERSESIGLDNFGFRYFDWEIGRFIQRDPSGYPDGLNNYLYCSNNPINRIDPLGLEENDKKKSGDTVVFVSDQTVPGDASAHSKRDGVDKVYSGIKDNENLVQKAESHVKETGNKIQNLQVSGHGYGAGVQTKAGNQPSKEGENNETKNINAVYMNEKQVDRLKATLTPDAKYKTFGCGGGQDEENLQDTANILGIPASGHTNNMTAGDNPVSENPSALDVLWGEAVGVEYKSEDADDGHWVTKKPQNQNNGSKTTDSTTTGNSEQSSGSQGNSESRNISTNESSRNSDQTKQDKKEK